MQIHCYRDIAAASIDELIERISGIVSEVTGYRRDLILESLKKRESLSPTAIGKGVMLPHIRLEDIEDDYIFFLRLEKGLCYKSPDGSDISFVFFIMSPLEKKGEYLRLVSAIVRMIKNDDLYNRISAITDSEELRKLLQTNLMSKGNTN
ncbi:MAG: PTS sugar transporter subunit IIA [Deltaproteobacteria bacterium]|nr:PTS sugar transporter subunit IIA [Deltaproteobacteria bacterium]